MADLFLHNFPDNSNFAESFRLLRTNVHFSFLDKTLGALLITSADAGEGKSTCAVNLAYTLAAAGKKVLVIDGDLRKPSLTRIFPDRGSPGLSGILSDLFSTDLSSGSLEDFRLADLVRLTAFQKRTGVLHLADVTERVEIHFHGGEPTDLWWSTCPDDKRLEATLIRDRVITAQQAEWARERCRNTGQKPEVVLVAMGFAREADMAGYLSAHWMEALRQATQMSAGHFRFEKRADAEAGPRPETIGTLRLADLYRQAIVGREEHLFLNRRVEASIVPTMVDHLHFLPSGPHPPKPAELLTSERMLFLIAFLRQRYDVLVIDTPPILLAGDALLLAPWVDGVLFVVRAGQATRELIQKGVEQVQRSQANLIGVVLNQVDTRKKGYYRGYYRYPSDYSGKPNG